MGSKWKFHFSVVSALLLILSFPRFNISVFAWVSFIPLFFALEGRSRAKVFLLSYLCGVIFWAGTIYWLAHVTLLGTILLILYLALYFGIFGFVISSFLIPPSSFGILAIPSLWVLLEYSRSYLLTGFPWALLGYSQYLNLPAIQIADITGPWGVSFLVMLVNVAIYSAIRFQLLTFSKIKQLWLPIACIVISFIYGYCRLLSTSGSQPQAPLKISVIQGNIPQDLKWDPAARDYILDKYAHLTEEAALKKPDLIIWPEASDPEIMGEEEPGFTKISNLSKKIKTPLLIGAVSRDENDYFNSALLIDKQGQVCSRYDKLHLVPFGEYIPLKKALPFLQVIVPIGDIAAGKKYTIFPLSATRYPLSPKFSVLICFEDLFPELSREFVKRGADFLVVITNDAWYKKTSAARQHLQASVFRAVENRVFLARAANTGVSAFIAPTGKIIASVKDSSGKEIFVDGVDTREINIARESQGFYARHGDVFIIICVVLLVITVVLIKSSRDHA